MSTPSLCLRKEPCNLDPILYNYPEECSLICYWHIWKKHQENNMPQLTLQKEYSFLSPFPFYNGSSAI